MINVNRTQSFIKQQMDCLDILTELIEYDKQHGNPPERARVLEGFIDTQRRALEMATTLLEKHKPALEEAEKAEREKREAEAKIKAARQKEEQKKTQVTKDLLKATTEEGSLFCSCDEETDEEAEQDEIQTDCEAENDDGYGFEENDED